MVALIFLFGVAAAQPWPGPPPKGGWALQPAALPKLKLGPDNCVDVFGTGATGGAKGVRNLFDEQAAAGDPSSGIGQYKPLTDFMPGWTKWVLPGDDPTSNGGIQGLVDLGVTTAVSDIWINHYEGIAVFTLELFAESPFDEKPVWQQLVNSTHNNAGLPAHPPYVCNGWGWNQRWCGWNISKTEAAAPKGRYLLVLSSVMLLLPHSLRIAQ
jgi:hypothetical protein